MFCEDVFSTNANDYDVFKSSFCTQYSSAGDIRPNSIVNDILEDYTRYFIDIST